MAFTTTESIFRRIEAALEFDLLGSTNASDSVDDDVNGHLDDPLNTSAVVERVERYVLDPVGAGDLYAVNQETGLTVGYAFAQQNPGQPENVRGAALRHVLPVEITALRVVGSIDDVLGGAAGYDVDAVMDDVLRIFGGARRDGSHFGTQEINIRSVQQLDGGSADAPWHGRIMQIGFTRSHRELESAS